MNCGTSAHIDLAALKHNLQQVKTYAPNSKIMAMIKSNAYGHGLLPVAKTLKDADAFGVACLGEGKYLRQARVKNRIVLMRGFTDLEELELVTKYDLEPVIHSQEQLEILDQVKLENPITAWLKIDTGMHRLGFAPVDALNIYERLQSNNNIAAKIHVITHLANADDLSSNVTQEQVDKFTSLLEQLPGITSIANSAGILNWENAHADWVRPGIMLYGVSPTFNTTAEDYGLKPVMTMMSKLISIRHLHKGDAIGYGSTWECPEDMPIGIVATGYGDGYPRHAQNGTPILVNGVLCEVVGRVSMDMLSVDLRNNSTAKYGDPVTLWGENLPIEKVAQKADTIPYELFCRITRRVAFSYQ